MKHMVVALVSGLAIGIMAGGFPVIPPSRRDVRCESRNDRKTTLTLSRLVDRWHVRNDVERAEEIGVRYGDSRRKTEGREAEHRHQQECTNRLLAETAARHRIPLQELVPLRGQRPLLVDVWVGMVYASGLLWMWRSVVRRLTETYDDFAVMRRAATIVIAVAIASVGLGCLTLFAHLVEIVRLWDGHMSYRSGRLPWEWYPVPIIVTTIIALLTVQPLATRRLPDRDGPRGEAL